VLIKLLKQVNTRLVGGVDRSLESANNQNEVAVKGGVTNIVVQFRTNPKQLLTILQDHLCHCVILSVDLFANNGVLLSQDLESCDVLTVMEHLYFGYCPVRGVDLFPCEGLIIILRVCSNSAILCLKVEANAWCKQNGSNGIVEVDLLRMRVFIPCTSSTWCGYQNFSGLQHCSEMLFRFSFCHLG